ncbi:hypothetical protein R6Q59_002649 [Mikania micrantha]
MIEKYEPEFKDDDPNVWGHAVNAECLTERIYGIGSLYVDYVVIGKASTSFGIAQSDHDQRLSQEKIYNLEVQMEVERKAREELQEQIRQEKQEMQNQMNEAIKNV